MHNWSETLHHYMEQYAYGFWLFNIDIVWRWLSKQMTHCLCSVIHKSHLRCTTDTVHWIELLAYRNWSQNWWSSEKRTKIDQEPNKNRSSNHSYLKRTLRFAWCIYHDMNLVPAQLLENMVWWLKFNRAHLCWCTFMQASFPFHIRCALYHGRMIQ